MKTTLRIFRIISKLLLMAYVTIVNFVFITVFYALLLSILRHIWPAYIPGLFDEGLVPYLVNTLPYYLLLLFILYSISPLNVWMLRRKEGYRPLNSSDRMRLERLLSEMGVNRKLKLYRNNDARVNAAAFGFNTIGLTGGVLATASDEELKGIISHEVGHISHYDFVYQVLLFSMESFGYRCLYGIFLIPALIFGIIGSMVFALVPGVHCKRLPFFSTGGGKKAVLRRSHNTRHTCRNGTRLIIITDDMATGQHLYGVAFFRKLFFAVRLLYQIVV